MACPGVAGWALDTSLDAHCGRRQHRVQSPMSRMRMISACPVNDSA
jgi:hypothetical protein